MKLNKSHLTPTLSADMMNIIYKQVLCSVFVVLLLSAGTGAPDPDLMCYQSCASGGRSKVVNCGWRSCMIMFTPFGFLQSCARGRYPTGWISEPSWRRYYCNGQLCNDGIPPRS